MRKEGVWAGNRIKVFPLNGTYVVVLKSFQFTPVTRKWRKWTMSLLIFAIAYQLMDGVQPKRSRLFAWHARHSGPNVDYHARLLGCGLPHWRVFNSLQQYGRGRGLGRADCRFLSIACVLLS